MLNIICERLKLRKFTRDEGGSLAILMGISMVFIVLLVAVVVDLAETNRARVNFQNALDAGTLAAAKIIAANNDRAAALAAGKKVFAANLGNLDPSKGEFDFNPPLAGCAGGDIVGEATLYHQVFFDVFHHVSDHSGRQDHIKLEGSTSVACANDSVEIALVLDNSGSMGGSRLSTLKSAATDLVNEIHNSMGESPLPEPVKFALVPFSSSVNIGGNLRNSSFSETGLDKKGHSPIHHENFNMASNQSFEASGNGWKRKSNGQWVTRFSFYDGINVDWKGCVEARPYPLNTTDEDPSESKPETLIVPMFAPDEPDNWHNQWSYKRQQVASQEVCKQWKSKYKWGKLRNPRYCKRWTSGGPNSSQWGYSGTRHPQNWSYRPEFNDGIEYSNGVFIGTVTMGPGSWVQDKKIYEKSYANSYMLDDVNFPSYAGHPKATPDTGFAGYDVSGGQINRQGWTWKYGKLSNGSYPYVTDTNYSKVIPRGPNFFCNSQPIQPLTSSKSTVVTALNNMKALGATAISQGAVWGWRALSPGKPFTQGLPKATPHNKKIMIIMSDGNNTYYPGNWMNHSLYGTYGFKSTNRIYDGIPSLVGASNTLTNLRIAMDIHLIETCENAKKDGISIFTIAFEVEAGSPVKAMLNGCASPDGAGAKQYYDATDKATLIQTFKDIAKKLSDLTITG